MTKKEKNIKQKKCKNCKGKGYVPVYFMMASRARGIEECPVCKGTGKIETEIKEKHIEELEEKISVLLSCKDCPENKGGLICQKEYENKCLAQKIQFIKELQQENAELRTKTAALENANRAMVKELDDMTSGVSVLENVVRSKEQLTKAKKNY